MTISDYALKFLTKPYIWGGDGSKKTYGGFDCSGLVLKCLWDLKKYKGGDITAQGIRNWAIGCGRIASYIDKDALLFFGKGGKITHVAISLGGGYMIEAGGGGRTSTTPATSTGCVRIMPISWRKDFLEAWAV